MRRTFIDILDTLDLLISNTSKCSRLGKSTARNVVGQVLERGEFSAVVGQVASMQLGVSGIAVVLGMGSLCVP